MAYKKFESGLAEKIRDIGVLAVTSAAIFVKRLGKALTRRYTIVLVPHSEKKVYNLHISTISVLCFLLLFVGGMSALFWYGASNRNNAPRVSFSDSDNRLRETQASLDLMREETTLLLREVQSFQAALSTTLSALGRDVGQNPLAGSGDLATFFNISYTPDGVLPEVTDVRRLSGYISSAVEPIREIGVLLDSQSALLTEIPSIWPVRGGIGHISMFFGQNRNPFTGQYYIHRGIDISTHRQGDPILATADGQVVNVGYESHGYGNFVVIRHRHGFHTLYAHMLSVQARMGQRVQQGEVIGFIGNTGLSTGPHLHYEVHIGSDVVDPYKYINIRSNLARNR
jgi:murein DD-endopeptidase MepM/ murein hydrolase activator NlpD